MSDETQKPEEITAVEPVGIDPRVYLTAEELEALDKYEQKNKDPKTGVVPSLAASTAAKFFELFLRGHTTKDIHNLNKSFDWGLIVGARIKYNWDQEREVYLREMFAAVRDRMVQAQAESVHFLVDMLNAAHKNMGDKIRKYIQSGDEKDLGDIKVDSLSNYAKVIALLAKITGQDNLAVLKIVGESKGSSLPVIDVTGEVAPQLQSSAAPPQLPPATAAALVQKFLKEKK